MGMCCVIYAYGGRRYANKDVYVGSWKAGVRAGKGVCVYAGGARYEGIWKRDLRDGEVRTAMRTAYLHPELIGGGL